MGTTAPKDGETCAECGADRPADQAEAESEPTTHCEWCGAEYPIPERP